jgi:hypothetical protein
MSKATDCRPLKISAGVIDTIKSDRNPGGYAGSQTTLEKIGGTSFFNINFCGGFSRPQERVVRKRFFS